MGLGTKSRQKQTADICKPHLREKYRDQRALVEEFIVEIEGPPKSCDVTRWGQFTVQHPTDGLRHKSAVCGLNGLRPTLRVGALYLNPRPPKV